MSKNKKSQQNFTIFIVDDEDSIRSTLQEFFEDMGHPVKCALNGKQTLSIAQSLRYNPPDIAIIDIRLPDLDGISLAKKLLTIWENTIFLFYTGSSDIKLPLELSKEQRICKKILTKPLFMKEIYGIILKLLENKKRESE